MSLAVVPWLLAMIEFWMLTLDADRPETYTPPPGPLVPPTLLPVIVELLMSSRLSLVPLKSAIQSPPPSSSPPWAREALLAIVEFSTDSDPPLPLPYDM